MNKRLALTPVAAALIAVGAACGPPAQVDPLLQRTACSTTDAPHTGAACTHWIDRNPAWGYPADTQWVGPWSDYLYDLSHGNGAELMP